jgi:broad specificity phosphatase PhoE
MSRVFLLRHGESASNAHDGDETVDEEAGDRLTEAGIAQARAAAEWLPALGIGRLLTSPMRRARETAEATAERMGVEPTVLPCARELEIGESFEDALGRVRRLKAAVEEAPADEPWLVVTHGIFKRFFLFDSLLGERLEAPMAEGIWRIGSRNCGLSLFSRDEADDPWGNGVTGWACHYWMERPWERPWAPP